MCDRKPTHIEILNWPSGWICIRAPCKKMVESGLETLTEYSLAGKIHGCWMLPRIPFAKAPFIQVNLFRVKSTLNFITYWRIPQPILLLNSPEIIVPAPLTMLCPAQRAIKIPGRSSLLKYEKACDSLLLCALKYSSFWMLSTSINQTNGN